MDTNYSESDTNTIGEGRNNFLQDVECEGKHVNVDLTDNLLFEGMKTLVLIYVVFIPIVKIKRIFFLQPTFIFVFFFYNCCSSIGVMGEKERRRSIRKQTKKVPSPVLIFLVFESENYKHFFLCFFFFFAPTFLFSHCFSFHFSLLPFSVALQRSRIQTGIKQEQQQN